MSRTPGTIPAAFRGHTSTIGLAQTTPDLTGRIGKARFTGHGSATISGAGVQSGDVWLSNSQGSIHFTLGVVSVTQQGKKTRPTVPIVVVGSTGAYAPYTGKTGVLDAWHISANPRRLSYFGGYLNMA
jgi:hypothetical protein